MCCSLLICYGFFHCRFPNSSVTLDDARSIVHRARNIALPPHPSSLQDMYRILTTPGWERWGLAARTADVKFFNQYVMNGLGHDALLFYSSYLPPYVIQRPQCSYYIGNLKLPINHPADCSILVIAALLEHSNRQKVRHITSSFISVITVRSVIHDYIVYAGCSSGIRFLH